MKDMLLKKAVYKKVMKEVSQRVSDEVYGCDCCKKTITQGETLDIDVFFNDAAKYKKQEETYGGSADKYNFCSWECVIKKLSKIKTDYFISLPFLRYDNPKDGRGAKDFLKLFTPPPPIQKETKP